jgi:TonB dependent receptor/Carboxypeptidase regulatory-like domain
MMISTRRNKVLASVIASTLAGALAAPSAVYAQTADSSLQGTASANATITVKNIETGLTRKTKANADGSYALIGLPPGHYTISTEGGVSREIVLSVASTSTLDLDTLAAITVTGQRLVEVRTPEVGSIVSLHEIETVPQLTRNFLEFADSVPGAIFNVGNNGAVTFRSGASTPDSANIFIDGVSQKGYVRSGQAGQSDGSQGNPFPQLAIDQYKVITSNYKAEYDQLSSAAISAATKSGTNEFKGEAFATYSSDKLRAMTPGESTAGTKVSSQDREFGMAVGGPIIQDKAHFFVSYEGKRYTQPVTVTYANNPTPPDNIIAQLPASVQAQVGPSGLPFNEDLFFGKLDYEPSDMDRIVISSKVRHENSQGSGAGVGNAESTAIVTTNNDTRADIRWQHTADRWYNEAVVTYEDAFFQPTAINASSNGVNYTFLNGQGGDAGIINTGGSDPRATQNKGQKGYSFQDDITIPNLTWLKGEHTVKAGIKYKLVDLTAMDACGECYPTFNYNVTSSGVESTPYNAVFPAVTSLASPVATSTDRQLGLYFQDDWKVDQHLQVNLGIRWDAEWNGNFLNWVTPSYVTNMLNSTSPYGGLTWAQLYASGPFGYNINDYVSNGHNRKADLGEIQPRLGFSYDINGDQKYVVVGGAGRAYDRDLFDYLQLEQVKLATSPDTVHFNTASHPCTVDGVTCLTWNPSYLNGPQGLQQAVAGTVGDVFLTNNKLKAPYSDQFSLGIHAQVGDWQNSATITRVNSHNGFTFLVGARGAGGAFWVPEPWGGLGTPWDVSQGVVTPHGMGGNLVLSSNGVESRTTQLLLSTEKPFTKESGWSAKIAYTYTNATTNSYTGDQESGFTQNEFSANWPTVAQAPWVHSNFAPKHRIVMTGSYQLPWDVVVGGKITLASPLPDTIDGSCLATGTFPAGNPCTMTSLTPSETFGYRSVDMQFTKNFVVWNHVSAYVRADVLNLFNTYNFVDYNTTSGANGLVNSVAYNQTGNIGGSTRTLRMTIGGRF